MFSSSRWCRGPVGSTVAAPRHDSEESTMSTFPLGGTFVSGLRQRDELGTYTSTGRAPRVDTETGTYTGVPAGRVGRFVDTQFRRPGTATSSTRTVTGSVRTATGSFRTA
ncbi:hypothetical protein DEJ24_13490 [Curtobacterium sp. MCPF17_001]|nr:hypothetical protein DEJ24_13490 [Curtobacterium sp. MCPF17_001]